MGPSIEIMVRAGVVGLALVTLSSLPACDSGSEASKGRASAPAPEREAAPEAEDLGYEVVTVAFDPDVEITKLLAERCAPASAKDLSCFVEFRADWCGPCKKLEASMDHPLMRSAFQGVYLVRLELDPWSEGATAAGFEVAAIPVFFAVDAEGKPTRHITGGAWAEDIPENMAPALAPFFHKTDT